jgi:hypothetical protein
MADASAGDTRDHPTDASGCAASLRALASGDLRHWHGLANHCGRADAEAAFGPSQAGPDGSAMLAGALTAFRRYPPAPAAPYGVVVWFEGNEVVLVEIVQPTLAEPLQEQIGPPEGTADSGLAAFYSQRIYAGRGLTAHVHDMTGEALRLYAYHPMTMDAFLATGLAGVEIRRIPLND